MTHLFTEWYFGTDYKNTQAQTKCTYLYQKENK